MVDVQSTRMVIAVAVLMVFTMTMALAQQTYDRAEFERMTDEQRAAAGFHYCPAGRTWHSPEERGLVLDQQTQRWRDENLPGWYYDAQTRVWQDELRPGWTYDPLVDRWAYQQRPGEVYDMRTGRWFDADMDRRRVERQFEFDAARNRWYDYTGTDPNVVAYFDADAGRWRREPMDYRDRDRMGALPPGYVSRTRIAERPLTDRTRVLGVREVRPGVAAGKVYARTSPASFRPGFTSYFTVRTDPAVIVPSGSRVTAYLTPADEGSLVRHPVLISRMGDHELLARADISRRGDYEMVIMIDHDRTPSRVLRLPVEVH